MSPAIDASSKRCADRYVDALGNRPRVAPHAHEIPTFEGIPAERLWEVARAASTSLATVFAVAGGHTNGNGELPVERVRRAARELGARA